MHEDRHDPDQATGGDDIDWQAERRWSDRPWVTITVPAFVGVLLFASADRLWDSTVATGLLSGWCAAMLLVAWQVGRVRKELARETGVRGSQIPVLVRRLQKERLPSDPPTRRAMALLVRRQRRQIHSGRWLWPTYAGLLVALGIVLLVTGEAWLGGLCVALVVPAVLSAFTIRRTRDRLDRLDARLSPDSPGTGSPATGS